MAIDPPVWFHVSPTPRGRVFRAYFRPISQPVLIVLSVSSLPRLCLGVALAAGLRPHLWL